jgi:hypothetical protein
MDRFELYECCVQSPRHVVNFLRAAHGEEPLVLREDFCGTAAVSRRWAADGQKRGDDARALGVDLDEGALARAREMAVGVDEHRLRLARGDCFKGGVPCGDEGADVIFVGNFSLGYISRRRELMGYLRASLGRLARGNCGFGGGIFVCDTYGGAGAYRLGAIQRRHTGPRGEVDPMTATVENSISFRVERDGEVVGEMADAFRYRWRLWTIAELREAMEEAGFASTEVHVDVNLAPGERARPVEDAGRLGEDWSVLIVGRTGV